MKGGDFLTQMAASSRARAASARAREPEAALRARLAALAPPPMLALETFDVIAEIKRRSPAAGGLVAEHFDAGRQIAAYSAGGAAAVSVLTETDRFDGALKHLSVAADALRESGRPAMRKDFLTDPYQVLEARAAGAGGVLVIVTMLDDDEVMALVGEAHAQGLFVLLEGFDRTDLERMAALDLPRGGPPVLAGVNCRNLKDLQVDFANFEALARHLPPGLPAVAESGIENTEQIDTVATLGYDVALIGSALMRAGQPEAHLAALIERGRARRGGR
jgi:indole-3-glycerol phosphate synthase